ncbi:MAG: sensor histidine kinase, partial [Limisphaerales bacterium]
NSAYCHLLGYNEEEITKLRFTDVTHPDDLAKSRRALEQLLAEEKKAFDIEKRYICKEGKIIWVQVVGTLLRDEDGKPFAAIAVVLDITAHRQAEIALQQSEQMLRLTFDSAQAFVIITTDLEGRILEWNPGAENVFGWKRAEVIGVKADIVFTPEDRAAGAPEGERATALKEGTAKDERWHLHKSGQRVYISGSVRRLNDPQGNPIGFAKFGSDLTFRKQMEDELRKSQSVLEKRVVERTAKLEESLKAMQSFTYSIAHDLRAPLRAMRGFTYILLQDYGTNMDERGRDYSRRIDEAAGRMDALINDLLQFGQLAHARMRADVLQLEEQFERVIELYGGEIRSRNAEIILERPLHAVCADEAVLQRVLGNLISNALKFVEPDIKPVLRIRSERADGCVRLWVTDNGIGIEPRFHEQIFGTFQRLHEISKYPGTGMGLAIVRKGVEQMGGKVGVESELGKGSRFWIELPADVECHPKEF